MVYVFKTTVSGEEDIEKLRFDLDHLDFNIEWNFDLEDCDNILRVESPNHLSTKKVINLLLKADYGCSELD